MQPAVIPAGHVLQHMEIKQATQACTAIAMSVMVVAQLQCLCGEGRNR